MAVLDILIAPDPRLKVKAKSLTDISPIQSLVDDMLDTMYSTSNGIGLAAPQVGRTEAIIVIDISENRDEPLVLINPRIVSGANGARRIDLSLSLAPLE